VLAGERVDEVVVPAGVDFSAAVEEADLEAARGDVEVEEGDLGVVGEDVEPNGVHSVVQVAEAGGAVVEGVVEGVVEPAHSLLQARDHSIQYTTFTSGFQGYDLGFNLHYSL